MTEATSMCLGEPLFLAQRHREALVQILDRYVPGQEVWAFGSRATGKYVRRFSDLDLAVERSIPRSMFYGLRDALDESKLPIKVDLVELDQVDTAFAARIRKDFVLVRSGGPPPSGTNAQQAKPV